MRSNNVSEPFGAILWRRVRQHYPWNNFGTLEEEAERFFAF